MLSRPDIQRVRIITGAALVAGIACSHGLWLSPERMYPQIPILPGIPALPLAVSALILLALFAALVVTVIPRAPRWTAAVPVGLLAVLIAFDQSRLQPWVVTYCVVFLLTAFARDAQTDASALMTLRFVIAIEYVWSGLQKANVNFIDGVWPAFSDALTRALHLAPAVSHVAGASVPVVEIAIGCALFIPGVRRIAVIAACGMHATILASLIGSGENAAVWPWNIAMPLFDIVLFWNATSVAWRPSLLRRFPAGIAAIVLVGFLPVLSFWGYWDAYASAALYSGNTAQAGIVIDPAALDTLPPTLRRNTWQASRPMFIDINRWSYDELQVPVYPERRVFLAVGHYLCHTRRAAVSLLILGRPDWLSGNRDRTRLLCSDPSW